MKILLLANQPESTTRLQLFRSTLDELGFTTIVPTFSTRNWVSIARQSRDWIIREKPDVVHLFNVPDIIYRKLPDLKGKHFQKLIYDYRSPWGIELEMLIGPPGRWIGERCEKKLAQAADAITTVNGPLKNKVEQYSSGKQITIIPNYPSKSFILADYGEFPGTGYILFVGRISRQEGIHNLLNLAKSVPDEEFWIVGDGPFSWWYLRKEIPNVKFLGWQSHDSVRTYILNAKICLIIMDENKFSRYATDKSVWKLNEYLNFGRMVIASGITKEEERKNLVLVAKRDLKKSLIENRDTKPKNLTSQDYRFWEQNTDQIKRIYQEIL